MSTRIVTLASFDDADGLREFIERCQLEHPGTQYIKNSAGTTLDRVALVEETLSDGSKVHDFQLLEQEETA